MGQHGTVCYTLNQLTMKNHFYFQIIAGVLNVVNFENTSLAQVRRISNTHIPPLRHVDLAIVEVHQPFLFMNTVKEVSLAPFGFIPPGNSHLMIIRNKKLYTKLKFTISTITFYSLPLVKRCNYKQLTSPIEY